MKKRSLKSLSKGIGYSTAVSLTLVTTGEVCLNLDFSDFLFFRSMVEL